MKNESPKKPKLFLTSNDVSDLTGYSLRNSRKIISHVRDELNLSRHQAISIYAFSKVFTVPADVLFIYINTSDFKTLPVTQEDLSQMEQDDIKQLLAHFRYLTSNGFDGIINQPRSAKINSEKIL